jgi:tRNA A37 methylthiotransferase MiaB
MKNLYLINKNVPGPNKEKSYYLPSLWCSAKTYYEKYGNNPDEWNWGTPDYGTFLDEKEILNHCKRSPPDIFSCSVYLWNENFMDKISQKVKEEFPDCVIVYGGPQNNIKYNNNFFKQKHWVDIVVPGDAYGEIIFKEILDNYPIIDFENIPYVYYTNEDKDCLFSKKSIDKKSFCWPNNIYQAQEKHLGSFLNKPYKKVVYETSRGCPYKCIYCDWGGGIYDKISKKPYTVILDELEWLAKNEISEMYVQDANFGIFSIDVDIAEYIVELSKKYGYPKSISIESAKNNVERSGKIKSILIKNKLLSFYKISVNSVDKEVEKNVERINPPIEDQIQTLSDIRNSGTQIDPIVESMLGLPGETYQTISDQFDLLYSHGLHSTFVFLWQLLPESPAYSPELRKKFQIKTSTKYSHFFNSEYTGYRAVEKYNYQKFIKENTKGPFLEVVTETYSYTRQEWIDMMLFSGVAVTSRATGIFDYLIPYICNTHNIAPSTVINDITKIFFKTNSKFTLPSQAALVDQLNTHLHNFVYTVETPFLIEPNNKSSILMSPVWFTGYTILTDASSAFNNICNYFAEKLNDEKIIDLGKYIGNLIIDLNFDYQTPKEITVNYNWKEYFNKSAKLTSGVFCYKNNYTTYDLEKFNWSKYQYDLKKIETFFYMTLLDISFNNIID